MTVAAGALVSATAEDRLVDPACRAIGTAATLSAIRVERMAVRQGLACRLLRPGTRSAVLIGGRQQNFVVPRRKSLARRSHGRKREAKRNAAHWCSGSDGQSCRMSETGGSRFALASRPPAMRRISRLDSHQMLGMLGPVAT